MGKTDTTTAPRLQQIASNSTLTKFHDAMAAAVLAADPDFSKLAPHFRRRQKSLVVNDTFALGYNEIGSRPGDNNADITWQYEGHTYYLRREMSATVYASFIDVFNRVYAGLFEIVPPGDGNPAYRLYRLAESGRPGSTVVEEDATLNQFARKCFRLFYELDRFEAFWNDTVVATGWNGATFRTLKDRDNDIVFTGLLRADKTDDGQYFPEGYERDGHTWFLPSGWSKTEFARDTHTRNSLSVQCLQRMVALYYPDYEVVIADNAFRLVGHGEDARIGQFSSSDLSVFWARAGRIVLEADENFSRLSRYYHKGHIRVRTSYGGACNFSLGYYDKTDSRVDGDVSFEYDGHDRAEGQTFYLTTDLSDTKAFERFVPVFNEAYRGVFSIDISTDGNTYNFTDMRHRTAKPFSDSTPRQVIYFGAPGTGKSHRVNEIVNSKAPERYIRTTFHPDSDYASFVGCYKPTMRDGKIAYAFTAQAFTEAYLQAWSDTSRPFFLIIEEINRGNCAQIFGDIFQLLDRDAEGCSRYPIKPDADLRAYIADNLRLHPAIPEAIRTGEKMRLPSNLFIYATMNTSDQSLFPMDSAFKRRWEWRYTAIRQATDDHRIMVNGHTYSWSSFLRRINERIYSLTHSEDKQLGYWFIMPDSNGVIDWRGFVSKAVFYLRNDVVRDYAAMEADDSPLGNRFAFTTFFDENGDASADQTVAFLDALGVEKIASDEAGQ